MKTKHILIVLLLLHCGSLFCQQIMLIDSTQKFGIVEGFCTKGLFLNPNNTYTFESGCENRSSFSFGTFEHRSDTSLLLTPLPVSKIIDTIEYHKNPDLRDSTSITILDAAGQPVQRFDFYLITYDSVPAYKSFRINSPEKVMFDANQFDSLYFISLSRYDSLVRAISVKDLNGYEITVHLNVNSFVFQFRDGKYVSIEPFVVIVRNDTVVVLRNFRQTILTRQNIFGKKTK